ncbi:hypothetical protein [Gluconobacter cerinus]|uniref:hypothetical protein n=1 Tax=Gluconobacter cerinus TaxID=38307 RepID=UPI001B8D30DD|nr:hypothetical protein [Gluconobacter cerinus]MBS0994755.1 hypothetical protein [Gluconobacter cerinus]
MSIPGIELNHIQCANALPDLSRREARKFSVDRVLALIQHNSWSFTPDELIDAAQRIEAYLETGK